jgi:hypothetical protein
MTATMTLTRTLTESMTRNLTMTINLTAIWHMKLTLSFQKPTKATNYLSIQYMLLLPRATLFISFGLAISWQTPSPSSPSPVPSLTPQSYSLSHRHQHLYAIIFSLQTIDFIPPDVTIHLIRSCPHDQSFSQDYAPYKLLWRNSTWNKLRLLD